jgi:thioredoxin
MNSLTFTLFRTLALVFLLGFSTKQAALAQTDRKMTPDQFEQSLATAPDVQLVDVRTREEYAKEHLKKSLNIDYKGADFEKHLAYLDKNKPTYVYCLSGGRSTQAAAQMRAKGFTKVYELDGGILKWNQASKPVEKSAGAVNSPGMSTEAFNQLLKSHELVLVDFGAKWCSPCKKMNPVLEKLSANLQQQFRLVKIDVDDHAQLVKQQNVSELPALFLYKNQQLVWQQTGFMDEAALRQLIESHSGK